MSGPAIDIEAARRTCAEGLRLCLAQDDIAGLERYRSVANPRSFRLVPLGLHVQLLREAGRESAAESLAVLTLRRGGDLAWRATRGETSLAAAAAEYEAFLARGQTNPLMMNRYLGALTLLGRIDEVAAIFDLTRLLHSVQVGCAETTARALLDLEGEAEIGSRLSVRGMREILAIERSPQFAPVFAACRAETQAYQARWAASDHPLASLVPSDFAIGAWGMISRGEGYNTRHHHPVGWTSGVYYPVGLDPDITGGSLRIGGWRDPAPPGWPAAAIRPEAGLLVLMPSYYVHWTEPLGAPGLRLSIAFDAMPV